MVSYRVKWTQDRTEHVSAVSYDSPSAEHRKARLETEGASAIQIVPVKPGQ